MTLPDFPSSEAEIVAQTTADDMINGGHRTHFFPLLGAVLSFGNYVKAVGEKIVTLAAQVADDAAAAAAGSGSEATVPEIRAGAAAEYLSIRRVIEAQAPVSLPFGAAMTWNMDAGINFRAVLTGEATLGNPEGVLVGKSGFLDLIQDSVGARRITSFGSDYRWFGPEPSWPGPNGITKIAYFVAAPNEVHLAFAGYSE